MGRIAIGSLEDVSDISGTRMDARSASSSENLPSNPDPLPEIKEVIVERIVEVPVDRIVEVPVDRIVIKEHIIDRPVEIIKEVIKEVIVEKIKEVPVEVIKEVMVDRPIEILVDKLVFKTPSWVVPTLAIQGVLILGLMAAIAALR